MGPRARIRPTPVAPDALPPNPPGLTLSRLLGRGGMGSVYLALDTEMKRQVAVKLLHAPGDPTALDRLELEARSLAALAHPNVITVFAAKLKQHPPHYTMEFVPGGTLARFVAERGPLAPLEAAEVIEAVARGAHAANQEGFVHRDIKPGNVLLQAKNRKAEDRGAEGTGSEPHDPAPLRLADVVPKLSDFGLTRELDRTTSLTPGVGILGTPGFMAPEQVTNAPVGAPTDVYGLGATLYHALTGRSPFEDADPHKLMGQIERAEPVRVRAVRPDAPIELEAIVHKCLEKKPADRYATAEEVADDLGRFLENKPVRAKPLTRARRAWKAVTRNRVTLARVAAAVCVLASVFAIGAGLRGAEEPAWENIEKELAAGRAVTLVGATGEPRCFKWALGPAEFAPGESGAPCSFSAMDLSMLDLCRDPMNDSYQIRAELSQTDVTRTPDGLSAQDGGHEIGLYFGRQTAPGANGLQAQIAFLIKFGELPYTPARLVRVSVPRSRATTPGVGFEGLASVPFDSAKQVPGPWRMIEIDVTQAGIEARWIQPDGAKSAFRTIPLAEARAKYSKTHEALNKLIPGNGVTYPAWNARAPIGIWAYRSVVTVRNVTLTPIP